MVGAQGCERGGCGITLAALIPTNSSEDRMAKKATAEVRPERVIALIAGESGTGKSFLIAHLKNALIFDTDLGGGLAYADRLIQANNSERIEVGSYLEVLEEIKKRRSGALKNITTLAIDHLTTLQQEAVNRHNPNAIDDFGRSYDKATREWRKIRELVRFGDFNLFCTAHMKAKYEKKEVVGITTDASKNIEADFSMVLYLKPGRTMPSTAVIHKWRRMPDDPRGAIIKGTEFPFTMEDIVALHGYSLEGQRHEIAMATAEQIAEMDRLIRVVKLPEGTTQKWLSKAKADSWADFTQDDIEKCLNYLKSLMNGQSQEPEEAA